MPRVHTRTKALGWGDDQIEDATVAADKNAELRGGRPVE